MKPLTIPIIIALFLGLIGVVGDYFIKISGTGAKYMEVKWFSIGLIIYALTAFGWFYAFKNLKVSSVGVFYSLSSLICLTLLGIFYFKEKLSIYEGIGFALAITSISLLWRFG